MTGGGVKEPATASPLARSAIIASDAVKIDTDAVVSFI